MKNRNLRIDIIKSIGIILIVLGHTQMSLTHFVNLFHVGLFFLAAGYCFNEKYSDTVWGVKQFALKRFQRLYLPFVLWNLIFLCFRNVFCDFQIYSGDEAVAGIYGLIHKLSFEESVKQACDIILMRSGEQLVGASWF